MKYLALILVLLVPKLVFATGNSISPQTNTGSTQTQAITTGNELLPAVEVTPIDYHLNLDEEIKKAFRPEVSINTQYIFDLTSIAERLKILSPEKSYRFIWALKAGSKQEWPLFQRDFKERGEKELELSIFESTPPATDNPLEIGEEKQIFNQKFDILVYERSMVLILSDEIDESDQMNYKEFAQKDGMFLYIVWPLKKTDIELNNIMDDIERYDKTGGLQSNYITVWGGRDFIFDVLSKMNRELSLNQDISKIEEPRTYNILSISPYNIIILENYLRNFLANKPWISNMVLINEDVKFFILKQNNLSKLTQELKNNEYQYVEVNFQKNNLPIFFIISHFINQLSNLGYSTNTIYIFLIIPFILTIIVFFKHFIWLSPIGLILPLFVTLLCIKFGSALAILLVILFVAINILMSYIIEKLHLHYAPKMSFILILNIIIFIVIINISYTYGLFPLDFTDVIYFIIFILICERFINIIVSKDLTEYKEPFIYTIFIALVCYGFLSLQTVKIIILAYPEIIMLLAPINYFIGRFTGLRVTEYFRFREIIKTIDE